MKPLLRIHLNKYKENIDYLTNLLHHKNLSVMAVTKVFDADQHLIQVINQTMIDYVADSRIEHLKHMITNKPKVLLRISKLSEVDEVVRFSDLSLQSELDTIIALNDAAIREKRTHAIILMFDLGDLREGIYYQDNYDEIISSILSLDHIKLKGIGSNLTCYGGVLPSLNIYERLKKIKDHIEQNFNMHLDMISGGNSSSLPMIFDNNLPHFISNLRIGEAFACGRETAYGKNIEHMHDDVFTMEAEIIELKKKPSMPDGETGMNAFGETVTFKDEGIKTRAILGIGRLEVNPDHLIPPKGIHIVGSSSDHLIIHVDKDGFKLGEKITFKLTYGGILSLMSASFVEKIYV